jgi:ankyrin repeat protein
MERVRRSASSWPGGADVREMRNGRIALVEAVRRGEDESALILIETGSDTDFLEMREGSPFARPLFYAASRGNAALVKALLNANAGVDAAGYNGMTPLMEAARSGQEEVLRLLLESGAKIESVDNIGRTALIWAGDCGP